MKKSIIHDFIFAFWHPRQTQAFLAEAHRLKAVADPNLNLPYPELASEVAEHHVLSTGEMILLVWPWALLKAFYYLVAIKIGFASMNTFQMVVGYPFPGNFRLIQYFSIFYVILGAIMAPLTLYIAIKLWQWVIQLYGRLFGPGHLDALAAKEIARYSLVSFTFLVIPIIGPVVQRFAQVVYLFVSLRQRGGFSILQSSVVAITIYFLKYIIIILLVMLNLLYFYLLYMLGMFNV